MLYSSCIERAADVACLIINIFKDLKVKGLPSILKIVTKLEIL